jgi:hypothetical protein
MIAFAFGIGFSQNPKASEINEYYWRFVFSFPVWFGLLRIILFMFVFDFETPLYLCKMKKFKEAKDVISIIYKEEF